MNQHRSLFVSKCGFGTRWAALLVPAVLLAAGCDTTAPTDPPAEDTPVDTVPELAASIVQDGLTCETMDALVALAPEDAAGVVQLVREQLSDEEIGAMIEGRESCPIATPADPDGASVGEAQQALYSGPWKGETIESTNAGGGYLGWVARDSSSYNWMCNGGAFESPADFVLNVPQVPNAYAKASSLRVRANNIYAGCGLSAFGNKLSARVYSDNSMRVCVGYWTMYFCGLGSVINSDFSFLTVP